MSGSAAIAGTGIWLPKIAGVGNTPIYVNEGDGITGWTTTGGTISNPSASVFRLTKTTASGAGIAEVQRSITLPSSKDYIMYGRTKCNRTTGDSCRFRIREGAANFEIAFNWNSVSGTAALDTVSITGTTSTSTYQNIVVTTGWNSENDYYDWGLAFDSTNLTIKLYLRGADGSWDQVARQRCKVFGTAATLRLIIDTNSASGSWAEFDFWEVTRPNIVAIGDSICAGSTLYGPGPVDGTDYTSTWMKTANCYPSLRNSIIVNKGIHGNTSGNVLSRINADCITQLPKVVLLGACNNDSGSVSLAQRTTNIQGSLDLLYAASIKPVLIGSLNRTAASASNPTYRDYYETWWKGGYRASLTGSFRSMYPMTVMESSSNYVNPAYVQADEVHPNPTGYALMGHYYARR